MILLEIYLGDGILSSGLGIEDDVGGVVLGVAGVLEEDDVIRFADASLDG